MLFSRTSHGQLILTLEAQSSLVRSRLIWLKQQGEPEILFTDTRDIAYEPGIATDRFMDMAMKELQGTIDAVLERLYALRTERAADHIPQHIAEAHYILSSPWIACQARTLSLSFERPTRITMAKVEGLLYDERARLAPGAEGQTRIIEEKIFDVRLNGYSIADWHNKEAMRCEVSYALGAVGGNSLEYFDQACHRAVPKRHVYFHSSLLLQYVGLRELFPERRAYTLIHVHGELTDVVAVNHGSCFFFGSYPFGIDSVIRSIAKENKTDEQAATSFLNMYIEGRLEETAAQNAAKLMKGIADEWTGKFDELGGQSQAGGPLPLQTIITAHSHQKFFADCFQAAHPGSMAEVLPAGSNLYMRAIHSLKQGHARDSVR